MTKEPNPLSLEELKAKSLGEKLCEATRPFPGCWESLTEESRCIYEQTALRFAASLTHDETASAVIASLRAALEEAEGRAKGYAEAAMGNGAEISRLLVVNAKLGNALAKLTDACHSADSREELPEDIDGSMLDEAEAAIALIEKFSPVRTLSPSNSEADNG